MSERAELDFIRDRVIAYVRANPSTEPLLTEVYPEPSYPKTKTCKAGHTRPPGRKCPTCEHGRIGENDKPTEQMIERAMRIAQERPR